MNILTKNNREINCSAILKIGGQWKIAVIKNGAETYPLGEKFRNNLILDNALNVLAKGESSIDYAGTTFATLAGFLYAMPVLGDGGAAPSNSDTALANQLQTAITTENICEKISDTINGVFSIKKVYNFPTPSSEITVREIGMKTAYGGLLISRFLLPSPILLAPDQYIRLYYQFNVSISSLITPQTISLSNGGFDGSGQFKLCGRFDDIFNGIDSAGNPSIPFGDSPRSSFMPYQSQFCVNADCTRTCFSTAYMFESDLVIPAVNSSIATEWAGQRLSEIGGTIIPSAYVNGTFYRDIQYIFSPSNISQNAYIGGILFTVTMDNRQNTWDGWLWKFNTPQLKETTKTLTINLTQSVSRL